MLTAARACFLGVRFEEASMFSRDRFPGTAPRESQFAHTATMRRSNLTGWVWLVSATALGLAAMLLI
jgi:hypothetical protein